MSGYDEGYADPNAEAWEGAYESDPDGTRWQMALEAQRQVAAANQLQEQQITERAGAQAAQYVIQAQAQMEANQAQEQLVHQIDRSMYAEYGSDWDRSKKAVTEAVVFDPQANQVAYDPEKLLNLIDEKYRQYKYDNDSDRKSWDRVRAAAKKKW